MPPKEQGCDLRVTTPVPKRKAIGPRRVASVARRTKEVVVDRRADHRWRWDRRGENGHPVLRPHARTAWQARRVRPDGDGEGDLEVDAHHTVEDTGIARRRGPVAGARRQGGDRAIRRRARAARRSADPGGARPLRATVPRLRGRRESETDRLVRHRGSPRSSSARSRKPPARRSTCGCCPGRIRTTSSRRRSRRWRRRCAKACARTGTAGVPSTKGKL